MNQGFPAVRPFLILSILAMVACLGLPSPWMSVGPATMAPPAALARCDPNPIVLCLISFGVQEPDRMLINLFVPAELPNDLSLAVKYKGSTLLYSCATVPNLRTLVYCTGGQLPLAATISIEVRARQGSLALASGDFVVNALALATLPVSEATPSPPPIPTIQIGRTSAIPLRSLTPSSRGTRAPATATLRAKTPPAATGYPNP